MTEDISTPSNESLENQKIPPLTREIILDLWTKTYNTEGKPDWTHIFPYYHEDIIFQDSIQRIEGKAEFVEMCNRLTKRSQELNMEIVNLTQHGNVFIFDWIMTMMFKKYPSTPLYGATRLVINEEGIIIEQRDYYDLWGDIFNKIPRFGKAYRRFIKKKFG